MKWVSVCACVRVCVCACVRVCVCAPVRMRGTLPGKVVAATAKEIVTAVRMYFIFLSLLACFTPKSGVHLPCMVEWLWYKWWVVG
jgi:hypothetical protein